MIELTPSPAGTSFSAGFLNLKAPLGVGLLFKDITAVITVEEETTLYTPVFAHTQLFGGLGSPSPAPLYRQAPPPATPFTILHAT